MFNSGIRGRRARDGEGKSTIRSNFVEKKFPIPFISGFEISGQSDLNVDTQGGQTVVIIGNGFESGLTLTLDGVSISPVTVISGSRVTFTAPAKSAGTYPVVISNTNGASAILVPGIIFGESPIFSTAAGNIGNFYETKSISSTVSATSDSGVTYEIVSGSIPPGSTFSSSGVLSGTAPVEENSSTYTFTVKATDAELQSSTRQFNITVNTDVVNWIYPANGATVKLDDTEVNLNLLASSAAGYPVSYSASSLPQGFSVSSDGTFSGNITQEETVTSTLTATSGTTNRTGTITVNWVLSLGDQFISQTSLLLPGTASTFITDASDNQFTVTPGADVRPSAFNPFDQGWATYIDGSDYYEVAQNSSLAFQGGGAFTWETFINMTTGGIMYGSYTGPSNAGGSFTFSSDSTNKKFGIGWIINGTDTWNFDNYSDNDVLTLGKWHHIAASYDGAGTLRYFVDGVLVTTRSITVNVDTMVYNIRIGRSMHPSYPEQFVGWLSNMRFIKGLCLYTEGFTAPDSRLTPVSGTVFLGFTAGDALYDASLVRNTIAKAGTTEQRQVNGLISSKITEPISHSIYFDGIDDYIYSTTPMLPSTSTSTFTIEGWFYTPSAPGDRYMIFGDGQPTVNEFNIGVQLVSNRTLRLAWYNGSQSPYEFNCTTTGTANLNSWNWFAVVVNNNAISIYLNSATPQGLSGTTTLSNRTSNKYMMAGLQQTSLLDYLGYISNIRVSTIARTITAVPTAPYETDPDTRWLVAKSSSLIDMSGNNHDPIVAGNQAKLTTANPFGYTTSALPDGLGSGYFDGSGDDVQVSNNAAFDMTGTSYCFEAWIYPLESGELSIFNRFDGQGGPGLSIQRLTSGSNRILIFYTGTQLNGTIPVLENQWTHIACTFDGTTKRIFVNGVLDNSTTSGTMWQNSSTFTQMAIGRRPSDARDFDFAGYISDARIVKGSAVYTENFTPPTSPLTAVAGTQLLTLQNRISYNNSQPIDESGFKNVITRNGNTSVGAFSPHVPTGWSGYFGGGANSDYLSIPTTDSAMHQIGDWTYEGWIYWNRIPTTGYQNVFGTGNSGQNSFGLTTINGSGWTPPLRFSVNQANIGERIAGTTQIQVGQWYHFALVRSSGVIKLYVNGNQEGNSYNNSTDYSFGNNVFTIGRNSNAYISNFRFVRSALYNIDFDDNLPTEPFSPIAGTSLLTLRGSGFTDDGPKRLPVTRVGDTRITPFSPFKPYTATPDSYSVYFDGVDDTASIPYSPDLDVNTGGDYTIEFWLYLNNIDKTQSIANLYLSSQLNYGWILSVSSLNNIGFAVYHGTDTASAFNSLALSAKQWYHIAISRTVGQNNNEPNIAVNGVGTTAGPFAQEWTKVDHSGLNVPLVFGRLGNGTTYLDGYLSNFRIIKGVGLYPAGITFPPPTSPLTAISGTSLLTCQSPTVIDNSTNDFEITVNGNSQPSKFNPFGETVSTGGIEYSLANHSGSVYFDGNDTLSVDTAAGLVLASDFTIESWVYVIPGQNTQCLINTSPHTTIAISLNRTGIGDTYVYLGNGSSWLASPAINSNSAGKNLAFNSWNHVALVRFGSTITLYHNGEVAGTTTTVPSGFTGAAVIGGLFGYTTERLKGYVSNFRVVKGIAVYTSAFVPPQSPASATPETVLNVTATNAAIYDATGRNVLETVDNVRTLPESPYRLNKSVYFDGTDGYLSVSSSANLQLGSGDFTAEMFIYISGDQIAPSGYGYGLFGTYDGGSNGGWSLNVNRIIGANYGLFFILSNSIVLSDTSSLLAKSQWHHIAIVREGNGSNNLSLFLNGTRVAQTTNTTNDTVSSTCWIGTAGGSASTFQGYISSTRFVKGTALYSGSTYTVPTSPLTAVTNTQLLTCQSHNFKDTSTNNFTITRNGDAKITSRGPFVETDTANNAMSFDGTGDFLVMPYSQNFNFGTGDFTIECWANITYVQYTAIISSTNTSISTGHWLLGYSNTANQMAFAINGSGVATISADYTSYLSTWTHIAVSRSGTTMRMFFNGTQVSSVDNSTNFTGDSANPVVMGRRYTNSTDYPLNGFIDDLRVTKGVARYDLDFDPPTSRYKAK